MGPSVTAHHDSLYLDPKGEGAARPGNGPLLFRRPGKGGLFLAVLAALILCSEPLPAAGELLKAPRRAVSAPPSPAPGLAQRLVSAPIRFYQDFLSPQWGNRCAYFPSCSNYALSAIRKHGALTGIVMTFDRLQHEADEGFLSPRIWIGGEPRVYDPLENNDFWWYRASPEAAFPKGPGTEP